MVTFKKLYHSKKEIRYEYFPHGDYEATAGIIGIDVADQSINLIQPAERDQLITAVATEILPSQGKSGMLDDQSAVIENEIPILMDGEDYYQYAYYAIDKIVSAYNDGIVLAEGAVYLQ